jgi:ubiquinone/menaquinone biosynthesis C-methylase UbiE
VTVLDVGCGTGRVTEALLAIVPRGRVLAMDASEEMVALARARSGERAQVWCQDVLDLELDEPVEAIVSTATSRRTLARLKLIPVMSRRANRECRAETGL